jgi:nucleotide-binding universal stress UspA family protein
MFKCILVPTDGSLLSDKAVATTIDLAGVTGGAIVALHVFPTRFDSPYGVFEVSREVLAEAHRAQAAARGDRIFAAIGKKAAAAGVGFTGVLVENDDVWQAVLAVAKKRKCDAICMASHGRRGIAGVVLGSETHKVLTHSRLPVLVLR